MGNAAPAPSAPVPSTIDHGVVDYPDHDMNSTVEDHPDSDSHELQDHLDSDIKSADKISHSILNTNWKQELLQVTGPQGEHRCKCGNSHATLLVGMSDNDLRNVLLLLDNKNWMITLIEKIDSLLLSMGTNSHLSSIITKFTENTCLIFMAK